MSQLACGVSSPASSPVNPSQTLMAQLLGGMGGLSSPAGSPLSPSQTPNMAAMANMFAALGMGR